MSINYNAFTITTTCNLIVKHSIKLNGLVVQRLHFVILKKIFINYFNGDYIFKNLEFIEKDKELFECIDLQFQSYITLYNVVNRNWNTVKKTLNSIDITNGKFIFERPIEIIAFILINNYHSWNSKIDITKTDYQYYYRLWCEFVKSLSTGIHSDEYHVILNRIENRSNKMIDKADSLYLLIKIIVESVPKKDGDLIKNNQYLLYDNFARRCRRRAF